MPCNTLMLYMDIIKTLIEHGPSSIHKLEKILEINSSTLKKRVNFLTNQGIIREKNGNSIATYVITKRGTEILKFFKVQTLIKVTIDEGPNSKF